MTNAHRDDDLELYIAEPCSTSWDELTGDDARRYCSQCSLHVIYGPAITRTQAIRLVQGATERVCMRLEVDELGAQRFRPEAVPASAAGTRGPRWIASASAAILAACARTEPSDPPRASPTVVEATCMTEPLTFREPTILDPLPEDAHPRRSSAPVVAAESAPRVPIPSPVEHHYSGVGGAVAVRRVDPRTAAPK